MLRIVNSLVFMCYCGSTKRCVAESATNDGFIVAYEWSNAQKKRTAC